MAFLKTVSKQRVLFILLAILAIAAFFRLYQLAEVPAGLYPDVAINGNDALNALKTHNFKLFYPENNGREGLFINLIALSFWLFGASVWAIKIVPALIGLLTVLGIYFLTKQLFSYFDSRHSQTIGLLASFFLSISFWHVNFSRLGFRAIMVPFLLVWSFYLLFKAVSLLPTYKDRNTAGKLLIVACWLSAGILFGLGFHTYIAFRVAPVILLPALLLAFIKYLQVLKKYRSKIDWFKALKKSYLADGWFGWDLFIVLAILTALPIAVYFWQHSADFMNRTGQISVLSSANPVQQIVVSAIKTLGQFVVWGDNNWRHNIPGSPQIFWPLIPFFLLGLGCSLLIIFKKEHYRRKSWPMLQTHATLIFWWGAMLLPSIMTNEGLPHSLRSIGAIPPSYIFVALGVFLSIQYILSLIKKQPATLIFYSLLIVAALALIGAEYYRYFIWWGQNPITRDAFTQRFANEARYLKSLPAKVQKYVLVNEGGMPVPYPDGLPMPAQTIIFFNRQTPNIKYFIEDPSSFLTPDKLIKNKDPLVILPMRPDDELFKKLRAILPAGQIEKINDFKILKINFK